MRHLPACLALLAAACGAPDRDAAGGAPSAPAAAVEAALLRVPRAGGRAAAYPWGSDSAVWRSATPVPPLRRLLGFDADRGLLAALDTAGRLVRLDMRLGAVAVSPAPAALATSADGWGVFGLDTAGALVRLTPTGPWRLATPGPLDSIIPLADGSVLLLSSTDADRAAGRTAVRRLRPPATRAESIVVPTVRVAAATPLGDRVWLGGDSGLVGIRTRDFRRDAPVALEATPRLMVPTPSGDRLYVATERGTGLVVVDRWNGTRSGRLALPDAPMGLRMDPEGRYLLARSARGDSTRVIAVGTGRLVATVRSLWRPDLPAVTPDGALAVVQGDDVVLLEPESRRERRRWADAAADWWIIVAWDGFRPRDASLDEPVRFAPDSMAADSTASDSAATDSTGGAGAAPPAGLPLATAPRAASGASQWMLSFASVPDEQQAARMATRIVIDGRRPTVMRTERDGAPLFRVVMGPYATRAAATADGTASGRPFWTYPVAP